MKTCMVVLTWFGLFLLCEHRLAELQFNMMNVLIMESQLPEALDYCKRAIATLKARRKEVSCNACQLHRGFTVSVISQITQYSSVIQLFDAVSFADTCKCLTPYPLFTVKGDVKLLGHSAQ